MNTLTFVVTLSFSEPIDPDKYRQTVADNIVAALRHEIDGIGLAPYDDEYEGYTTSVVVSSNGLILVEEAFGY